MCVTSEIGRDADSQLHILICSEYLIRSHLIKKTSRLLVFHVSVEKNAHKYSAGDTFSAQYFILTIQINVLDTSGFMKSLPCTQKGANKCRDQTQIHVL